MLATAVLRTEMVAKWIRQTLEPCGVTEARSGAEVLAVAKEHQDQIVLAVIDFLMFGLTGLDLAAKTKRLVARA